MKFIKPEYIYAILILFFFIAIMFTIFYSKTDLDNSKIYVFFIIVAQLSTFVISLNLIISSHNLHFMANSEYIKTTNEIIDRSSTAIMKNMKNNYEKCPNFIASLWSYTKMFPVNKSNNFGTINESKEDPLAILELSTLIFQAFEDHLTCHSFDFTGEEPWCTNFLIWTSSDKLYEIWQILKPTYKKTTIAYTNLLFEYANKFGKIKDINDLTYRSKLFINDARLNNILGENG